MGIESYPSIENLPIRRAKMAALLPSYVWSQMKFSQGKPMIFSPKYIKVAFLILAHFHNLSLMVRK